jgi:hypothetical protein
MRDMLVGYLLLTAQACFTYTERSALPVKDCKIYTYARRSGHLSRDGFLSCHIYCDTGPPFSRSHLNDRLIQSPLTTHKGMWRIYSNPDPQSRPIRMPRSWEFCCSSFRSWGASTSLSTQNEYTPVQVLKPTHSGTKTWRVLHKNLWVSYDSSYTLSPVKIRVRIDPPHPLVCRKRRLNGAVLRMRPEKPRSHVTAGVAR